jgi:hypothetical protein
MTKDNTLWAVSAVLFLSLLVFLGCTVDLEDEKNNIDLQETIDNIPEILYSGRIVIVYTNSASLQNLYHDYTPEDFAEFNCYEVWDAEAYYQNAREGRISSLSLFSRIIDISVRGENAEEILRIPGILMERPDIQYARVDILTGPYDPPSDPEGSGTFEDLDLATELRINYDFAYTHNVPVSQVGIRKYYGSYNGCAVVLMDGPFMYLQVITGMKIAGLSFSWGSSHVTIVWEPGEGGPGKFHRLNQAFDLGLLTEDNIKLIHERHYPGLYQ